MCLYKLKAIIVVLLDTENSTISRYDKTKQASNIKGSCSSQRTKGTKEEQTKGGFSDRNTEGRHHDVNKNDENLVKYFFLKVCYLDCAKFYGLLGVIVDDGYKVVTNVHLLRVTAWVGFTGRHQCGNMEDN